MYAIKDDLVEVEKRVLVLETELRAEIGHAVKQSEANKELIEEVRDTVNLNAAGMAEIKGILEGQGKSFGRWMAGLGAALSVIGVIIGIYVLL